MLGGKDEDPSKANLVSIRAMDTDQKPNKTEPINTVTQNAVQLTDLLHT